MSERTPIEKVRRPLTNGVVFSRDQLRQSVAALDPAERRPKILFYRYLNPSLSPDQLTQAEDEIAKLSPSETLFFTGKLLFELTQADDKALLTRATSLLPFAAPALKEEDLQTMLATTLSTLPKNLPVDNFSALIDASDILIPYLPKTQVAFDQVTTGFTNAIQKKDNPLLKDKLTQLKEHFMQALIDDFLSELKGRGNWQEEMIKRTVIILQELLEHPYLANLELSEQLGCSLQDVIFSRLTLIKKQYLDKNVLRRAKKKSNEKEPKVKKPGISPELIQEMTTYLRETWNTTTESDRQVAERFNVPHHLTRKIRQSLGLTPRQAEFTVSAAAEKMRKALPELTKTMSGRAIAKKFGLSENTVYRALKELRAKSKTETTDLIS